MMLKNVGKSVVKNVWKGLRQTVSARASFKVSGADLVFALMIKGKNGSMLRSMEGISGKLI